MRTLVVSDLHIGARHERAALEDERMRSVLAEAVAEADRLVLLGDVLELRQGPLRDALAAASRVLPDLVAGLRPGSEVVLVAGNHDHQLFAGWARRRGFSAPPVPLELETAVDWMEGEALAVLAAALGGGGARVRAAYPGVWLREDVYATHGHQLDCHTTAPGMERLAAGLMGRLLALPAARLSSPDDYERVLAPIYAWMLAVSELGGPELDGPDGGSSRALRILGAGGLRGRALQLGLSGATAALQRAGLGELSSDVSGPALRRGQLRGFGLALERLGLRAGHVLFGHTHRAGPLPQDAPAEWLAPTGSRLHNSGCWVWEGPRVAGPRPASDSAYRPGFAIHLDDGEPPRVSNLLER
ncbi:MAG: metallophosphoesterase [Solirubrobacteraceae bacterium]